MRRIFFFKMHGLGNDFVVLDARRSAVAIDVAAARMLANRHTGIGCDQLIIMEPPSAPAAQAAMRFLNPDGSEAEACGNGTRCVAWLIAKESGRRRVRLETAAGLLDAELLRGDRVAVDMGAPRTDWRDIPLARKTNTLKADISAGPLSRPVCTSMGNPHATFFVDDADAIDLRKFGPPLEHDALFPERANIGVATVLAAGSQPKGGPALNRLRLWERGPGGAPPGSHSTNGEPARIRLRVWERGAGLTLACGSGACAALVAAHRRGLTGRHATVMLDGGELDIVWRGDDDGEPGHVVMTGPATLAFEGTFDAALLGR